MQVSVTLKFEIDDWVLCPGAIVPTWLQVRSIEFLEGRYIVSNSMRGISFSSQNQWITIEEVTDIKHLILYINDELNNKIS